ncbi:glutamate--cysteine ligase [Kocuria sp. JC486]|uniref:Putative glutamate--cysteine ligase 2 n=1 Tax=Kocuria soli TaxID=2485125 RepID=A0A3N3ZSF3_9MICC|nr:glutamate--cysteine ligase [Kocuria soli]NHU86119.1 glutamate--cysteine ligase [Kocuria sp. JC486]ROZ63540.1 glutamate--cysteine ligase [Kocuria soli]
MHIEFEHSSQSTIGLEWEVALVDATTGALVPRGQEVMKAVHQALPDRADDQAMGPTLTGEFLENTVELVTGVCDTVSQATGQLAELMREIRGIAEPRGLAVFSAGTHPFSRWQEQSVVDKDRYFTVVDRAQYWGRQMVIYGMHVHVGVDSQDKALPVQDRLLAHYPHLLALSANSPYWNGQDTGYASHRSQIFQQLPTAGLPYAFKDWAEYEQHLGDLLTTGVIDDISESRLDVRPVPKFGTVEMRFCDAPSSLRHIGAIAALTQCLVEETSRILDGGGTVEQMRPWLVKENKWRAARYGLDAIIIKDNSLAEPRVTDHLAEIVERLTPIAEDLGCATELSWVLEIIADGAGYQRQRAIADAHDGDLRETALDVVRQVQTS